VGPGVELSKRASEGGKIQGVSRQTDDRGETGFLAILRLLRGGVTWRWDIAQHLQGLLCIGVIGINLQRHLELAFPCLDVALASKDKPQVPMQDWELFALSTSVYGFL